MIASLDTSSGGHIHDWSYGDEYDSLTGFILLCASRECRLCGMKQVRSATDGDAVNSWFTVNTTYFTPMLPL